MLGARKKAMPWPLTSVKAEMMPNAKETKKDCTVPLGDLRNRSGVAYKAWPFSW